MLRRLVSLASCSSALSVVVAFGCAASPPPAVPPTTEPVVGPAPETAPVPSASGSAGGGATAPTAEFAASIVAQADRSEDDRKLDAGRMPAKLLEFIGVRAGAKVADLGVGGGYTTELLARAVGPAGVVYGQNSKFILERFAEKPWSERLAKPVMKNVVRVDRDFDDPLPPEARDLSAVAMVLFYHDTVWMKVDRDRMNRSIFGALAPGGVYVIVDHGARGGAGLTDVETLHRIDEQIVRAEIESVGFRLTRSADFLRYPSDSRDWNASPRKAGERRGTSDRFVLAFEKP